MPIPRHVHLGLDLSDTGARAAAWRDHGSQAQRLFDLDKLTEHVAVAERGALDFVVFDESFALHPSRNTTLQGRLDPALVAARLAPRTARIGLVAQLDAGLTEPDHVAQAVATIDRASGGRAAWQVGGGALDGRVVDAVEHTWDAPVVADMPRPVDRRNARFVDVDGVHFAAPQPQRASRSPQGRPPVVVRLDTAPGSGADARDVDVAGRAADVVRLRVDDRAVAAELRAQVRAAAVRHGRDPDSVRVLVDAFLLLGPDAASAQARLDLLAEVGDVRPAAGSLVALGTAVDVASLVTEWFALEAADGFTFRPASVHTDLPGLVDAVVPRLRGAGVFRDRYPRTATLRGTLGLARPPRRTGGRPVAAGAAAGGRVASGAGRAAAAR
ncbi:LLM class flavin-dependent oxidoreductase [Cellulomonas sp.]|uniref:LLM class flavin-dependent oxidoreductase n=1 Tax=Cellulomonas sp. TaxID=40001 RepID=UPI001B111F81|nr:LLM class flavin-dependent oxidoreductase [Cellulomonas sp.]MBO9556474.1 LLM class flavin-dependent oxidoreductase [Cellulomonas sp.]